MIKVSIITVILNGESTIKKCIDSVLNQSYASIEHIIVDGGSKDGTLEILKDYGDRIGPWITEPDTGIYNALNKGLRLASGQYYLHLGCDDILMPTAVEDLLKHAGTHLVIMGRVKLIDRIGRHNLIYNHSAGTLIDMNAHTQLGIYDESYRIAADTKFLQLAERSNFVKKIDNIVGEFVLGGASSNYKKNIIEHTRAMREAGRWSVFKAILWIAPRLIFSIVKR